MQKHRHKIDWSNFRSTSLSWSYWPMKEIFFTGHPLEWSGVQPPHSVPCSEEHSLLEKDSECHSTAFCRKERQLWELVGSKLASSSVPPQSQCYKCALNRIEFTNWACAHCTKLNSKWLLSLRLLACTITESVVVKLTLVENWDIVDLHATNGTDLCVNHGDTLRECRASLTDEERRKSNF